MAILFDDIENAFLFVSMDQKFMHNAYLCKETGQIFYTSEMYDGDDLPDDIDDPDQYISIPHKNELDLGSALVFEFAGKYLPDDLEKIASIFRASGAYSRYKDLLERKGLLDEWYKFEDERETTALKQWGSENGILFAD